jgi:hypothetical protein
MQGEKTGHTFVTPSQPEGSQDTDDPEDILRTDRVNLPLSWVRTVDGKLGTRGCDDLLLFCPGELAQNGLCDCGGRLDGERVHEHI